MDSNDLVKAFSNFYSVMKPELYEVAKEEFGDRLQAVDLDNFTIQFWEDGTPTFHLRVYVFTENENKELLKHTYNLFLSDKHLENADFIKGMFSAYILLDEEECNGL